MSDRKHIPKKIRFEVFKRDSFTCQYCGNSAPNVILHIDHIHPVSKDGDNSILNLITSCDECNLGKSDTLLSDDSAILKQKAQLDELNERREQLEMMLQWREGLKEIGNIALDAVAKEWTEVVTGYSLNETGLQKVKRLVDTFGLNTVLDSIPKAKQYLELDSDENWTQESVELAFKRLGGICRMTTQPDFMRELYYIRGIARKRFAYVNETQAIIWLKQAYESGVLIDELRQLTLEARNWTQWKTFLFEVIALEDLNEQE